MSLRRIPVQIGRVLSCRGGSIAIIAALLLIPFIGLIGLGVDLTRLWLVQSRLQTAVDAAVLVAGRQINVSTAAGDATALFWANFGRTDRMTNSGFLGAVASDPVIKRLDADTVQVQATASVATTLMRVLGVNSKSVHAVASAKRALFGMELALVLDVTGSMKSNNNIGGLRTAANNLIDIVFGPNDTEPNLFVSVIPFVASVNFGKQHTDWLAGGSLDQSKYGSSGWAGCVEARGGGEDGTESTPDTAPFRPFLWASTTGRYSNAGKPVAGDNDWTASNITEQNQAKLPDNTAVGPNLSCPRTAVLPLTSSKATAKAAINSLQATFRGGTTGNLGLQAGWFTLSPEWAGRWGTPGSPLPYGTPYMQKILVMMTDGNNEWFDYPGGAPGQAPTSYVGQKVDADYTAYGRLSENRLEIVMPNSGNLTSDLASANSRVKVELNLRSMGLCTKMKQKGITIFTIVLGTADAATKDLWRSCASKPDNFFESPDKTALTTVFQQIGTQLASLRLSQ